MAELSFPRIKVCGSAFERGQQYGAQAAERVKRSVTLYREIFEHYAGWDWDAVTAHAQSYAPAIQAYRAHFLEEMRGIAEGAGLAIEDILALNVRTEIMFAAVARAAVARPTARECTAFVALPEAMANGHTLVGQNWDWKPDTAQTVVLLEAEPEEGPRFITAVEAGLLAKTGMNSVGIGLVTNALVTDQDKGEPGVPYHAVLRAILESETMSHALSAITVHPRASSANYLIAHRDGEAINVEAAPGDYSRVFTAFPQEGVYSHSNHFICPGFDLKDVELWNGPGSLFRQHRLQKYLQRQRGMCDAETLQEALADHFNAPYGICSHEDPHAPPVEDYVTILSIIMDLDTATVWLTDGKPCQAQYCRVETGLY
jgi:isopenicillin-N N-acyltransferase-like protein